MKFTTKLLLCSVIPALLFIIGLAGSIGGLMYSKNSFLSFISIEQKINSNLMEMYAQGLQMEQAMRNIILDPANQKAYGNFTAAEKGYAQAFQSAQTLAKGTAFEAGLEATVALRKTHTDAQAKVFALAKDQSPDTVKYLNATETPTWRDLREQLLKLIEMAGKVTEEVRGNVEQTANRVITFSLTLAVLAMVAAVISNLLLRKTTNNELGGDPLDARKALAEIAAGNLSHPVPPTRHTQSMMHALTGMQESLRHLVREVRDGTDAIAMASSEISVGNNDLSARTEQQAANLEETAASMSELTATVKQNLDNARQANQIGNSAVQTVEKGSQAVGKLITTVNEISQSSAKISDIIATIDGIAFQTNILALNAAVEAARAGEQGRGFAVVAGEVRTLAQCSAEAAKEIKTLIQSSVESVNHGVERAGDVEKNMVVVKQEIRRVADLLGEITAASEEQSRGIEQVEQAVSQMDQMTQQNAALVEQAAAAAASMDEQASRLKATVAVFKLAYTAPGSSLPDSPHLAKPTVAPKVPSPTPNVRTTSTTAALNVAPTSKATQPKRTALPPTPAAPTARAATTAADGDWESF